VARKRIQAHFEIDPLNRLTNVVDTRLSSPNNTAYDLAGNLKAIAYPKGITNRYTYDTLNRLTRVGWTNKNTGLQVGDFSYTLKPGGARTGLAETVSGTSRTFTWNYDNLYRLSSDAMSASPSGTLTYGYDAVGNRTSRTGTLGNLSPQTTSFDVNDEVDNDTTASTHSTWFDANGNNTSFGGTYTYDYANRLVTQASPSVTITYDADGNRIKKVTSSGTTWYLVAMVNPTGYPQVVEELTGSTPSTLSRVYSYGLSLISQRQLSGSVVTFYGTDGLGSVRFLADTSATIQNTYAYDAFGTAVSSNAAVLNSRLFAGEEFDSDLKLSYNRARYYDPATGRFFTMDTDEGNNQDPLSLHKYLYCADNPVNLTDPSGRDFSDLMTTMFVMANLAAMNIQNIAGTAANLEAMLFMTGVSVNDAYQQNGVPGAVLTVGISLVPIGQFRQVARIFPAWLKPGDVGRMSTTLLSETRQAVPTAGRGAAEAALTFAQQIKKGSIVVKGAGVAGADVTAVTYVNGAEKVIARELTAVQGNLSSSGGKAIYDVLVKKAANQVKGDFREIQLEVTDEAAASASNLQQVLRKWLGQFSKEHPDVTVHVVDSAGKAVLY
jgi:RHS repeat-associated protein